MFTKQAISHIVYTLVKLYLTYGKGLTAKNLNFKYSGLTNVVMSLFSLKDVFAEMKNALNNYMYVN